MRLPFSKPQSTEKPEDGVSADVTNQTVQEQETLSPPGAGMAEASDDKTQETPLRPDEADAQPEAATEAPQAGNESAQPVPVSPPPAEEPKPQKKRGFFLRSKPEPKPEAAPDAGPKKNPEQASEPKAANAAHAQAVVVPEPEAQPTKEEKPVQQKEETPKKKGGRAFSLRRKKETAVFTDAAPTELVHVEGQKVVIPTYEDIEKYGSVYYPVNDPYQYVNLKMENGELVYTDIEPVLTDKERDILKRAGDAYDMLVNVSGVLSDTQDKAQFLDNTFQDIIKIYNMKLSDLEYRRILYYINRDYVGFGRIDTLVSDRLIEDISCNGPDAPVYVYHRFFESVKTNITFEEVELNNFILRLAQFSGRHISILQPIRDAALPDGSRINMTLGKEVTKKGSTFTIRKFRSEPISPIEIMMLHTADSQILAYLWVLIEYGRSLLISGGTAAGKTTLLNAISMLIKPENKIVSVEDTPEINLAHPNWIQAVTRIGYGETGGGVSGISGISGIGFSGKSPGDISLFDLLIAALRQRPDFIIVGEVRGEEAYTLFQAISVGHATMGTIHAASMPELLARTESQPMNVPRVMIANLDLVIFVAAVRKGDEKVRRIREIVEVLGVNQATKELITNVVFRWDPTHDSFEFTGRSFQIEKISKSTGVPVDVLDKELANRVALLDRMKAEGVTNYKAVTEIVRQYYQDRDTLMRREALAGTLPVNTEKEVSWGGRSAGKS